MAKFSRVEIHKSEHIKASSGDLWSVITDWAGIQRWWLTEPEGGRPGPGLLSCELLGTPDITPRTRRISLDNGSIVEETLLHQNDQSRRIYYNMTPNAQVQSYFATMFIDEVDQNSCILHVSSCFDVAPDVADVDTVKSKFEATYEKALFNGLRAYFDK